MNNKDVRINETSPVIYAMEIESGLYTLVMNFIQIILEVGTIFAVSYTHLTLPMKNIPVSNPKIPYLGNILIRFLLYQFLYLV